MQYDSTGDTMLHIHRVGHHMTNMIQTMLYRMQAHDASKLQDPEKAMFDEFTPKLREMDYGSPEYKECTKAMHATGGLEHHYKMNSHHPEHHENGINGMSIMDMMEMLCDWKAAGERHKGGGDMVRSIMMNRERYGLSQQVVDIMFNTVTEMGWDMEWPSVKAGDMVEFASPPMTMTMAMGGDAKPESMPMGEYKKVLWVGERAGVIMMDIETSPGQATSVDYQPRKMMMKMG